MSHSYPEICVYMDMHISVYTHTHKLQKLLQSNYLLSSPQTVVSERVSQMSSSKWLWRLGAAPNHPDLILMCLPSPSLSLARPAGCSHSRGRREIRALPSPPDTCQRQQEGIIFII